MPPMRRVSTALLLALALAPAESAAQACGSDGEVFGVHRNGIVPDRIYHDDATAVCMANLSGGPLSLRYEASDGREIITPELSAGQITQPLVDMGDNVLISAVTARVITESCQFKLKYSCTSWCRWRWLEVCEPLDEPQTIIDELTGIRPARLYERAAPLSY